MRGGGVFSNQVSSKRPKPVDMEALRAQHNLAALLKDIPIDVESGAATVSVNNPEELQHINNTLAKLGFEPKGEVYRGIDYVDVAGDWKMQPDTYTKKDGQEVALEASHILGSIETATENGVDLSSSIPLYNRGGDEIGKVELPLKVELGAAVTDRYLKLEQGRAVTSAASR